MQEAGEAKAPEARVSAAEVAGASDAMAGRARVAEAGSYRGLHDAWQEFLEGHRLVSDCVKVLAQKRRLPAAWQHPPVSRVGKWLDASAVVFFSVFVIAILINTIEPFGLGNASKAQSMRITARAMAPFYESPARDEIAVVLIDDVAVRRLQTGWPPRYSDYEALLRRVLAHQPRAVYLDVLLIDERKYDDSLADARRAIDAMVRAARRSERLGGGQVPVYFGVGAPGARSLFSQPGGVRDVVTSWEGAGNAYPLQVDCDTTNKNARPLDCAGPAGAVPAQPTVAFALYGDACPPGGAPGCLEPAAAFPAAEMQVPMAVQWGWRPDTAPGGRGSDALACDDQPTRVAQAPPSWFARLEASAGMVWNSFWSGRDPRIEDRTRTACVYPATLFAEQLEDSALLRQDDSTPAALEDRVVLIGTNLLGLDDRVQSPVNQLVPGVYLHAMALDNLMTWGRDRVHVREGIGPVFFLLTAILISLAAGGALQMQGVVGRRALWLVGALVCLLLVGLAVMLVVQGVFRQPPQDWLGTALAAAAALYVVSRPGRTGKTRDKGIEDETDETGSIAGDPAARTLAADAGAGAVQSANAATHGGSNP